MAEREIADRIREALTVHSDPELAKLADELAPPRPEPGTVVWWQTDNDLGTPILGRMDDLGYIEVFGFEGVVNRHMVRWWPARIAGPMQETATIPPLDQWPEDAKYCEVAIVFNRHTNSRRVQRVITRDEAARREAE